MWYYYTLLYNRLLCVKCRTLIGDYFISKMYGIECWCSAYKKQNIIWIYKVILLLRPVKTLSPSHSSITFSQFQSQTAVLMQLSLTNTNKQFQFCLSPEGGPITWTSLTTDMQIPLLNTIQQPYQLWMINSTITGFKPQPRFFRSNNSNFI